MAGVSPITHVDVDSVPGESNRIGQFGCVGKMGRPPGKARDRLVRGFGSTRSTL